MPLDISAKARPSTTGMSHKWGALAYNVKEFGEVEMSLKNQFLDAIIDGELGNGIIVTRQEFMQYFASVNQATTGVFLSNSEINTGVSHSPSYSHFTMRVKEGQYRVHPEALQERMKERNIL